jgi:hypothetical protein
VGRHGLLWDEFFCVLLSIIIIIIIIIVNTFYLTKMLIAKTMSILDEEKWVHYIGGVIHKYEDYKLRAGKRKPLLVQLFSSQIPHGTV